MSFSTGRDSICLSEISSVLSNASIIERYLGVKEFPCVINSPLREDKNPSLGLVINSAGNIYYRDFSTGEHGNIYSLLMKLWSLSFKGVLHRIKQDFNIKSIKTQINIVSRYYKGNRVTSTVQCRVRHWKKHDYEYWDSYGISLKLLEYAEVYPVSHTFITKGKKRFVFGADKYAYVYVEHKEGKTTLKIYQPFNTKGFKWCSKHDKSVVSLWNKVPETGDILCICSSVKDALCLYANTGIPSIALQGEGYDMSNTAIEVLLKRFKSIYICLDNDEPGLKDALILAKRTGFKNVVLPHFDKGKDISDLRKVYGKEIFLSIILPLFNLTDTIKTKQQVKQQVKQSN